MFGGRLKYSMLGGDPIAETIILRFGEGVDTVHCIAIRYRITFVENEIISN